MIVFLIDADNLSAPAWVDEACRRLEADAGSIAVRRAYGSGENLKGLTEVIHAWAIRPFINLALSKNTTDVALAADAMELACLTPRPTLIAIGSGDADFLPLVVRLRERGIRMVCVSERSKMAQEAAHAYDEVMYVGSNAASSRSAKSANTQATAIAVQPGPASSPKAETKKTRAKKTVAAPALAQPPTAKKAAAKKTPASAVMVTVTVAQILNAAPTLKDGEAQALGEIVRQLHDAKLLGKNASSPKFFNKHPQHFELTPTRQPNQVRYIPVPRA